MDNGGIWPGDESYFQEIRETSLQDQVEQLTKELAEARAEIENKQYTIACASEENQQLKESLAEAQTKIGRNELKIRQLDIECDTLIKQQRKDKTNFANALQRLSQEIDRKDRLAEQMREALNLALKSHGYPASSERWQAKAEAALSAAERINK